MITSTDVSDASIRIAKRKQEAQEELIEETLFVLENALRENRADGMKFAVLDTRKNFVELRTVIGGDGWEAKFHAAMRKVNIKHRVRGFALGVVRRDQEEGDHVMVTYSEDFNNYNPSKVEHYIYETKRGIIDGKPLAVIDGDTRDALVALAEATKEKK